MKLEFPLRPQRTNPVYSRKGRARLTCADKAGVPPVRSEVPASLAQTNQNFTRKLPLHLRRQTRSSSISSRSPCAGKAEVPPQGAAGGPPRRGQRGPEARRARRRLKARTTSESLATSESLTSSESPTTSGCRSSTKVWPGCDRRADR